MRAFFPPRFPPRRSSTGWVIAGLLAVLGTLLLSPPASAADQHVDMQQYAYAPASLTISAGDSVTWTNHDTVAHDVVVTSGPESFRSPLLEQGQSWSHTFSAPGTYTYICSVHPDMQATVAVAAAPAPQPSSAAPTAAAPAQASPPGATTASGDGAQQQPAERHATPPKQARQPARAAQAPATEAAAATTMATGGSELDPLLLVGGMSIAVVVFCLLLLASRPTTEVPDP